ncbi:MAG TPA: permease-like cell division protein FtsX [Candidatus Paceibacterota bacterium]
MTSFKRILKSGAEKFLRDRSSTGAALVVMTIALFVVSSLFILQGMSTFLVEELEEGVDVSAYFQDSATEEEIFQVREQLLGLGKVAEVEYVSKEEALRRFREAYEGNEAVLASLDAIGRNPLLAHLNLKARDPREYSSVVEFLGEEKFSSLIADVDFHDREPVIERLTLITKGIQTGVLAVIVALSVVAVLVAFNTIRLTIYGSKDEIEIMRLVGASSWFIRGPFLVQGVLVGMAASLLTLAFLFGLSFFIGDQLRSFTGFDVSSFLARHLFVLFLLQLACGIGLGILSSTIAIRKYLRT